MIVESSFEVLFKSLHIGVLQALDTILEFPFEGNRGLVEQFESRFRQVGICDFHIAVFVEVDFQISFSKDLVFGFLSEEFGVLLAVLAVLALGAITSLGFLLQAEAFRTVPVFTATIIQSSTGIPVFIGVVNKTGKN